MSLSLTCDARLRCQSSSPLAVTRLALGRELRFSDGSCALQCSAVGRFGKRSSCLQVARLAFLRLIGEDLQNQWDPMLVGRCTTHFSLFWWLDWDVHWGHGLDFDPWQYVPSNPLELLGMHLDPEWTTNMAVKFNSGAVDINHVGGDLCPPTTFQGVP